MKHQPAHHSAQFRIPTPNHRQSSYLQFHHTEKTCRFQLGDSGCCWPEMVIDVGSSYQQTREREQG